MNAAKKSTTKRAAPGTIKLPELIDDVITRIKRIDSNKNWDQSEKTRRHRALGESVQRKLQDRRKSVRISDKTFQRYLSDVRRAVTEQNWHHHSLDKKLDVLARRYPALADEIKAIKHDSITDTKKARSALLEHIRDRHDHSKAYEDIVGLKVDHEIMLHLKMPAAKKAAVAKKQQDALIEKKTNTISVEYHWLMTTIHSLLHPDETKTNLSFARLALGIGFATGRRPIEILYQGEFKKAGKYELDFSGVAKKRGDSDYENSYRIYTLAPADDVLAAFKLLRSQPEVVALSEYSDMTETDRNIAINRRTAKNLNNTAKRVWMDEERRFYDVRALWARVVFEKYFKTDKRWANVDEDIFWHEQLCHDDVETQTSYKQFKIDYSEAPEVGSDRLSQIKALLDHPEVQRRKALRKITEWAVETVQKHPDVVINQNKVIQGVGSGRGVIQDWLAIAEEALGAKPSLASDNSDRKPELKNEKPRIKAIQDGDDEWTIEITIDGEKSSLSYSGTSKMEAMKMAWDQFTN